LPDGTGLELARGLRLAGIMKLRYWLVAFFAVPASLLAGPIFIKAGHLIDGHGGAPLAPVMIKVDGDRITDVGTTLAVPAGAQVIDLGGATLLPGLIDLHTHLTIR